MRRIPHQRQTMGGELTGITSRQRKRLTFAFKAAQPQTIIKSDIQRLIKLVNAYLLHTFCFLRRERPDDRTQVWIAERQECQDPLAVKRLTRNRTVRFLRTDSRHQRMMTIIPEGERNIRFVAQPGVSTISTDDQAGRQHCAIFQGQKCFVLTPGHLL